MKKGCFIKFIIILTIVVAAVLYFIQNKFYNVFLSPGKEIIKKNLDETWQEELAFIKPSPQKDSLKIVLRNFIDEIQSFDDISGNKMDKIKNSIEAAVADSIIDNKELEFFRNLLNVGKDPGEL